jgi:hypothetical protein
MDVYSQATSESPLRALKALGERLDATEHHHPRHRCCTLLLYSRPRQLIRIANVPLTRVEPRVSWFKTSFISESRHRL